MCNGTMGAKVLEDFLLGRSFEIISLGKSDLLVRHAFEPQSNKTRNNLQLRTKPIVFAVQIVAGVSFL